MNAPQPRWTLTIDTAHVVCAALARDGELVCSDHVDDTRAHTEALTPMIVGLCQRAGITLREVTDIVVGVGPGPFTGLRVGIVTAHTLAALAGTTPRGVCSLDALALQAVGEVDGAFVTTLDARRKEIYWARHDASGRRLDGPHVSAPDQLPTLPLVGPGARAHGLDAVGPADLDAGALAVHADRLPDLGLEPLYLRQPDATVPTSRKSTLLPPRPLTPRRRRPDAGGESA